MGPAYWRWRLAPVWRLVLAPAPRTQRSQTKPDPLVVP
jgi:hypothetical protein